MAEAGTFIVFEGLDGSGKSAQAALLAEYMRKAGREVVMGKEPTADSDAGKEIMEALSHQKTLTFKRIQELFILDRKEHLETVILPALAAGSVVIEDRYSMSSFAYGSLDLDLEWIIGLHSPFAWPDITIILKVGPDAALRRIATRSKPAELFEKKERLRKVGENYDRLAARFPKCVVIDGERTIEEVHAEVLQRVAEALK